MTLCSLYFKSIFAVAWGILIEIKVKGSTRHSAGLAVIQGCCAICISYITLFTSYFFHDLLTAAVQEASPLGDSRSGCWPGARGTAYLESHLSSQLIGQPPGSSSVHPYGSRYFFPNTQISIPCNRNRKPFSSASLLFLYCPAMKLIHKNGWGICPRWWGPVERVSGSEQLLPRELVHWKITLCQNTFCFWLLWQKKNEFGIARKSSEPQILCSSRSVGFLPHRIKPADTTKANC